MARFLSHTRSIKPENSYSFILSRSVGLYTLRLSCLELKKKVKHFTKIASSESKSEDLHDDPICIVRTPSKIYDPFKERMEILPLNQVI